MVEVLRAILSGARVLTDTLRKSGRSIVYISHFPTEVMRIADRVTVLRDDRNVGTVARSESSVGSLISMILRRPVTPAAPRSPAATGKNEHVLVEVKGLTSDAFHRIDLQIGAGEVVGLYGAIGADHFEAARALFGLCRCYGGTISV